MQANKGDPHGLSKRWQECQASGVASQPKEKTMLLISLAEANLALDRLEEAAAAYRQALEAFASVLVVLFSSTWVSCHAPCYRDLVIIITVSILCALILSRMHFFTESRRGPKKAASDSGAVYKNREHWV